ncbi:MAG: ABC transporter transmembrane domain-containing protein, partial [Planctomycetota bacterium]
MSAYVSIGSATASSLDPQHESLTSFMHPFLRVLRVACGFRAALVGIGLSSLVIAGFWGANITVLYPMVEIVFKPADQGNDFPGYVRTEIEKANEELNRLDAEINALRELGQADADYQADSLALTRRHWSKSLRTLTTVQPWVDAYAPRGPFSTLMWIVAFLIVGTGIKLVCLTTNLMLVEYVSAKTVQKIREQFFRHALHLDLDQFGENGSANLTSRLTNDVTHIGAGISILIGRTLREPLKMFVCLGLAAYVCPRLLLLVMIVSPVIALVMQKLSRAIRRASRRVMEEMSQLYGMLNDAFGGIRVIKSCNTQAKERARFHNRVDRFFRRSMKASLYNTLARCTSEFLGLSVVGTAILAG